VSCNNILCRYFASQFSRDLKKIPRDGELFVHKAVLPSWCDTTFRTGSSIGSQQPGVGRAIIRHVYPDPVQAEHRILGTIERLLKAQTDIGYTTITGMQIDVLDFESLIPYSDLERDVADALIYGVIYGIHHPEVAQSDIARWMEEDKTLGSELRKAGLKSFGKSFKNVDEWNGWTLKLVRFWEREHNTSLAIQETRAVWEERCDLIPSDGLSETYDRALTGFVQISGRSARFRAAVVSLGDKVHPDTWMAIGHSVGVGFCIGAGWLHEDAAIEYIRVVARGVKRSIKSAKSRQFGPLLARLSIPLPDDETVAQAYLLAMWEGARFGAHKHGHPTLAARAEQQRRLLLA